MGKHYVPQAHLRRFETEGRPGFVWMYDKKLMRFSQAAISKVAQEPDFYDQDVEAALAEEVERPGNICIDKTLRREKLDNGQRSELSLYLMTMATRGPRRRRKSLDLIPEVLESVVNETREQIRKRGRDSDEEAKRAAAQLAELEALHTRFAQEPPQQILDQLRTPFWSMNTVTAIHNMVWHILPIRPPNYFVTCDTPAHFFDGRGLGRPDSEFTFPISKDFALIGEHRQSAGMIFEKPDAQLAKEVNRRVLSHAERFVFSPRKDAWIEAVAQKSAPFLSEIRWRSKA